MIRNSSRCALMVGAIFFGTLLSTGQVHGQGLQSVLSKSPAKPSPDPSVAPDPLGRDTPRDAIRNFLEACHSRTYSKAAEFLDLSKIARSVRATRGVEVAEQLGALLDRDSHFELEKLDNVPQGKQEDGLPADIELLQTFDLNTQKVPLYLERVKEGGIEVWLVSADSVLRIPELAHLAEGPAIEKKLPKALVEITFVGTALWVWLTLLTAALLISVLSRLLSKLVISF